MVYKTSWLASSLDYADKTKLAATTERRSKRSRTVLFRVLLDGQVRTKYVTIDGNQIDKLVFSKR